MVLNGDNTTNTNNRESLYQLISHEWRTRLRGMAALLGLTFYALILVYGALNANHERDQREFAIASHVASANDSLVTLKSNLMAIEDKGAESPANTTAFSVFQERLDDVLNSLTEREEKVLRLRFGLGDGYPRTLEEVGSVFNVTRERVRQIEAKALRKMRHPTRARELKNFVEWSLHS